ncbi:MAG: 50S ribosomal protein L24 [Candidatus Levybacteria bacterium CG10_big_fil_rev_8_21_14_0_10_36_7]|nr:MAG: 50S ribosomal protein L24 [Candidatus Levybacteria bacterium CG10_big_fil_rev_8_21_14_0_10_36_7]
MKLKKGDNVKVLIGKDKGKEGKILRVLPTLDRVLVEGVNKFKRHFKSKSGQEKSEIIEITKALKASKVAFVCPKCKKSARIGFIFKNDKKLRICKKCKAEV